MSNISVVSKIKNYCLHHFILYLAATINAIPYRARLFLIHSLVRSILFFFPRFKKIGLRNLKRAYPESDLVWRESVLKKCTKSLAILIIDFLRLPSVNLQEAQENFSFPFAERLKELKDNNIPVIYATGHLGSFELLAHYLNTIGHPLSFVARKFRPEVFDKWITAKREFNGNKVIERSGALKGVMRELRQKRDIAVLFDQNITREHAVFVPWFGTDAATSRLIGIAAIRTKAVVLTISMESLGDKKYKIHTVECNFDSLYENEEMSFDDKVLAITAKVSSEYEKMIRNDVGAWFWLHRRWKTAPSEQSEVFYADL